MKFQQRMVVFCLVASGALISSASFADTIKIALIDPMSGPMGGVGQNFQRTWELHIAQANEQKWAGDHNFELVMFDNKGSPQETLTHFKAATDQGIRYVVQGAGSGAALALEDAVNKHNERNPGKEVVYLNHSAVDPDMTNAKCSFWHFRTDAHSDMKLLALVDAIEKNKKIKKIFIIGQNYAFGQQVSKGAKELLKQKRPDIEVVGDELHPMGQVKDFAPYVAKIKGTGAQAVITGNWGADLALLIKAAKEANLKADFYTFYAGVTGAPSSMGAAGAGRVKGVSYYTPNIVKFPGHEVVEAFKKKYNDDYYVMGITNSITLLSQGIKEAKSTDPVKVAFAMEGAKFKNLAGEMAEMRKSDHQLQQPLFVTSWTKVDGKKIKYDQENQGHGWKVEARFSAESLAMPTSCEMKRPAQ